jgi:AraC-like DNA-binding protein
MRFYRQIPGPPLSDFVALLWLYEGYQQPHEKERLLPDGSMELVVNLNEDQTRVYDPRDTGKFRTLRGPVVVGAHSEFFVIDTAEQHNALVSLEDLWGGLAGQLRERMLEAGTPQAKLQVLEQTLLARAAQRLQRHPAVAFALHEFHGLPHTRTIAEVTGQIGLSAKRFIEVFRGEVGLTPKLFCRVRRFQRVLRSIGAGRPVEWAAVAVDCGYFDQAHFIRDFRAFSGINPSTYAAQRTEHLNHVPLIE